MDFFIRNSSPLKRCCAIFHMIGILDELYRHIIYEKKITKLQSLLNYNRDFDYNRLSFYVNVHFCYDSLSVYQ